MSATEDVSRGKPFFLPRPNAFLDTNALAFYTSYTGLTDAALEDHLIAVRDRAFKLAPYPCLGSWAFLRYSLPSHTIYPTLVSRVADGATVLDIGTGLGQELRWLFHEAKATDTSRAWATDIKPELWNLGFELFRDGGKFDGRMVPGDLRDGEASLWSTLRERTGFDIIIVNSIIHFFNWEQDLQILGRVTRDMTKRGTVLVGVMVAHAEGGARTMPTGVWRHDEASFKEMWKEVNAEHGVVWNVAEYKTMPIPHAMDAFAKVSHDDSLIAVFTVNRES